MIPRTIKWDIASRIKKVIITPFSAEFDSYIAKATIPKTNDPKWKNFIIFIIHCQPVLCVLSVKSIAFVITPSYFYLISGVSPGESILVYVSRLYMVLLTILRFSGSSTEWLELIAI